MIQKENDGVCMSYKLEIKREKDFLSAIVTGIRTSESIKNATREICENCIKNRYTKALVDVRDFKEHISTMNSFDLASVELPDIIRKSIEKVAILDMKGLKNSLNVSNAVSIFLFEYGRQL